MKLRILLINPPRVDGYPVVREERFEHKDIGSVYPPLSLLYTAAVLEKNQDFEIKLIDANGYDIKLIEVQNTINEFGPDVVFIRAGFDTYTEDIKVLSHAKDNGSVTILRNKIIGDTDWLRDEILKKEKVDIFLNVEPEAIIGRLMVKMLENKNEKGLAGDGCVFDPKGCKGPDDLEFLKSVEGISFYNGKEIVTTDCPQPVQNLDEIPFPAYHMLPNLNVYHTGVLSPPFALVQTSRGCPFMCTFCAFGKSKYRVRSVENVINEIKYLKEKSGIKSFLFFDDTISLLSGRTEKLAQAMIDEKLDSLEWVCCTRANLVNFEMMKLMKKAGMREIAIGIETGSEEILKSIKKGVGLDDIRKVAKWCHELGVMFYGLVIIGLPGETKETVAESVKFIKEIDPFYTQLCFATPFPNTEIYEYYEKNNYLLTKDWSKYFPLSEEPVVRTEALTAEQLKELRRWAYMKLLFRPMYLLRKLRPFDWKWNIEGLFKIISRIIRVITKKPVR